MKEFQIEICYSIGSNSQKITVLCDKDYGSHSLDRFVLDAALKNEDPHGNGAAKLILTTPRGGPGVRAESNRELMEYSVISDLAYEIDGDTFSITT